MKKIILIILVVIALTIGKILIAVMSEQKAIENSKRNYISGCVAKGASESRCECSFEKIIEKYGYANFKRITSKSGNDGNKANQELSNLVTFMQQEVPKLCSK